MQLNKPVSVGSAQLRTCLGSCESKTLIIGLQVWISSSMHCQKNVIPQSTKVTVTKFWLFIEISLVLHNVHQSPDQSEQI